MTYFRKLILICFGFTLSFLLVKNIYTSFKLSSLPPYLLFPFPSLSRLIIFFVANFSNPDVNGMKTDISKTDDKKKLQYRRLGRHYLADHVTKDEKKVTLTAAAYHAQNRILVVGFSIGAFFLYELPSVNVIHSLRYYYLFTYKCYHHC